jgi:hypothetical protein
MKSRLVPSLIFLAFLWTACAPATSAITPSPVLPVDPSQTPSLVPTVEVTPSVDLTATYMLELLSATPALDAQPVATSRGPDLEATNPTSVRLASGGLQLVEFFRFT